MSAAGTTDGRIQRQRSGGGGEERGGRPVLPTVGSSGSAVAAALLPLSATCTSGGRIQRRGAVGGVGKEHGVTGGRIHRRRGGSGYLPSVGATCAIGGRIQQRRGGGGGKERGDQPVLPEAGSSGSAVAAALFSL